MAKSGPFLLSPEVDLKLLGSSMRGIFIENGWESLFKRIERLKNTKKELPPALIKDLLTLLPASPWKNDFVAALSGDVEAQQRIHAMGEWKCFIAGFGLNSEKEHSYWLQFTVELEQASQKPAHMISAGQLDEVLAVLQADELLRTILWPEACDIWGSKRKSDELEPLLVSMVLEVRLSQLAAMDVGFMQKYPTEAKGRAFFLQLLPTSGGYGHTPTRQLMNWLKNQVGAKSLMEIFENPQLAAIGELDISTLKRWSSGRRYPSRELLDKVSNAVFGDPHSPLLGVLDTGVRYLNLIGYMAEIFTEKALELKGTPSEPLFAPWPRLPFGYPSFESWCQERYPVWLKFHQERLNHHPG